MPLTIADYARSSYQAPTVSANLSGVELLKSVANHADNLANEAISKWANARVDSAEKEGALAGSLPNVEYRPEDNTLSTKAYNEAAVKTHLSVLRNQTSSKLAGLQDMYSEDPEKYMQESTAAIQGVVSGLRESSTTRQMAGTLEAQLKAAQESAFYTISKKYQAKQIEEFKAANLDNMFSLKTDTYRNSSAIFSSDPVERTYALNQFATASKELEATLHAVMPNGKAVYDAADIQKIRQDFHTGYYVQAMKDYVTAGQASMEDMADMMMGKAVVHVPLEGGKTAPIDLMSEIGIDAFGKVQTFVKTKMEEREALIRKQEAEEKETVKENQKSNGFKLAVDIAAGKPIPLDMVYDKLARGEIDYTTANTAREMVMSTRDDDNTAALVQINAAIANGDDAASMITKYANELKPATVIALSKANETMQANRFKDINKENLKMFKQEFLKQDAFGAFSDLNMVAVYNDLTMQYHKMIEDGTSPQLAFEKIRAIGDDIKKADERANFKRLKNYLIRDDAGEIDVKATYIQIRQDIASGKIGGDLAAYYMSALRGE